MTTGDDAIRCATAFLNLSDHQRKDDFAGGYHVLSEYVGEDWTKIVGLLQVGAVITGATARKALGDTSPVGTGFVGMKTGPGSIDDLPPSERAAFRLMLAGANDDQVQASAITRSLYADAGPDGVLGALISLIDLHGSLDSDTETTG